MYWIYDIPNWQLCLLTVGTFGGLSLIGFLLTRPLVGRLVGGAAKHNDITSYFITSVGVLYGLTLGLIAVGTWQSVSTALPGVLWAVVLLGAVVNIVLTYLFWVENRLLHGLLIVAFAGTLAMLIFLTAAMDNPYRGQFSVSTDPYQYVLDHVMGR